MNGFLQILRLLGLLFGIYSQQYGFDEKVNISLITSKKRYIYSYMKTK